MNKRLVHLFAVALLLVVIVYVPRQREPVAYVDRQSGDLVTEKIPGEKWLLWLYDNPAGRLTLEALVKRKIVSAMYGRMMDSPRSARKIKPFIRDYNIDLSICQKQDFRTFNDFFTRKLKPEDRPVDRDSGVVVSPDDGRLMAYQDLNDQDFIIKGMRFDVAAFLQDTLLARKFRHGSLIVVRLAPVDYHRFHFPVDGTVILRKPIEGTYYSVNPLALRKKVRLLCENKRDYTIISSSGLFGTVVMAEVGATMVGSIIQTFQGDKVVRGEEKGYFKFGGSAVVLMFEKGTVVIDRDLLINTSNHLETYIHMGERIGIAGKI